MSLNFHPIDALAPANIVMTRFDNLAKGCCENADIIALAPQALDGCDLLIVTGANMTQAQEILMRCRINHCPVLFIANPSNDDHIARTVASNIKAKLVSKTMPDNLDVADLRLFSDPSAHLFAFSSLDSAVDFLRANSTANISAALLLAHGQIDVNQYQQANEQIAAELPSHCSFYSSVHAAGEGECSVLFCVTSE